METKRVMFSPTGPWTMDVDADQVFETGDVLDLEGLEAVVGHVSSPARFRSLDSRWGDVADEHVQLTVRVRGSGGTPATGPASPPPSSGA